MSRLPPIGMKYGNFGQTRLSSAVNIPITSKVAARVAYGSFSQDGTVKNLHLGTEIDTRDAQGARISVDMELDNSVLQFTHEAQSFEDSRLNWASQYCVKDMLLGCDPTQKGDYNTGAHYAGTIGAAFGFLTFMQPSKLTDLYANSPRSDSLNETYQDFGKRKIFILFSYFSLFSLMIILIGRFLLGTFFPKRYIF